MLQMNHHFNIELIAIICLQTFQGLALLCGKVNNLNNRPIVVLVATIDTVEGVRR